MVHLSDGRHLDLRELNKQKGGSGKNGFKHERTFVPGVDNGRPGAVPDHLRAAESAMKSLHTSNLDEFIKRLGSNLATAEYATMVRSGRSYSASKFNAAQKVSSALQRSANEIFRKPINRKLLFSSATRAPSLCCDCILRAEVHLAAVCAGEKPNAVEEYACVLLGHCYQSAFAIGGHSPCNVQLLMALVRSVCNCISSFVSVLAL